MCWEGGGVLPIMPHTGGSPKKGLPFLRLDGCEIVGISQVVGYGREGKLSFWSVKGPIHFYGCKIGTFTLWLGM